VREIDVNAASQGKGNNQRRRHQEICLDALVYPRFEVSVAREDGCGHKVFIGKCLLDVGVQRSRISNAGGASVPNNIKSEFIQIRLQSSLLQIVGYHPRTRRQRCLNGGIHLHPTFHRFLREQSSPQHHTWVTGVRATGNGRDQDTTVADRSRFFRLPRRFLSVH
jgi:hypothetical protein